MNPISGGEEGINHTELENGETPYLYLDMYFVDLTHEMYQYPEDSPLRAEICSVFQCK